MRNKKVGKVLAVRAIGGLHVVTLAWDFVGDIQKKLKDSGEDFLGFAIEREELDEHGNVVEQYFLRGIKRFKFKDEGMPPGAPVPTSEHPVQTFQWGDYTAKPATTYRYTVIPCFGKPKLMTLERNSATTVRISTEPEIGPANDGRPTHDIFFNRGVAGSQAYARKFGKQKPDPTKPESEQMQWLSRGLFEALIKFIGLAKNKDFKLRAMLYEFKYPPVGEAFQKAHQNGADVQIRYEAQSYKDENEEMIKDAGIKGLCKPQKSRAGIRHNKFIVLIHKQIPVAVWTGSTNISAGGIFGHSNVGHLIWDQDLAQSFLEYWERLAAPDVTRGPLVDANLLAAQTPMGVPPPQGLLPLYSPRDEKDNPVTLDWYAELMASAEKILCMTFAFNLAPGFFDVLKTDDETLRYAVFDKTLEDDDAQAIEDTGNSVIAAGAKLKAGDMENFLGEVLSGFNRNLYIHDKFMLVDPLGADPIVVTGSANFSPASQHANDENMIVIRGGGSRVADIYFGEFMRIFDHLYARYIVRKIEAAGGGNPDAGFLKENWKDWLPQHFKNERKRLRREYFMNE